MSSIKYAAMILAVTPALFLGTGLGQSQEHGQLIFEDGFESGKPPYRASGNSPEAIKVSDARAGNYVMK